MPTKKIGDLPVPCWHQDHDPARHVVLEDGIYEHTCPSCGESQRFEVSRPKMMGEARSRARSILQSEAVARRFAGLNEVGPGRGDQLVAEMHGLAMPRLERLP